jgi:hypothetical protein
MYDAFLGLEMKNCKGSAQDTSEDSAINTDHLPEKNNEHECVGAEGEREVLEPPGHETTFKESLADAFLHALAEMMADLYVEARLTEIGVDVNANRTERTSKRLKRRRR